MLSGAKAFEITDIREDQTAASLVSDDQNGTMSCCVENRLLEFLRTTSLLPEISSKRARSLFIALLHV